MSQPQPFPENHYQSLPHLRISKRKFLAIENDLPYLVKIRDGQSLFTALFQCSEIQKIQVQMQRSKNGSYLYIYILPRMGKRKQFLIRNRAGLGYSQEDWVQIPEFVRSLGFQSEPLPPNRSGLDEIQSAMLVTGPYRYFASEDKIFRLFENPEFMEELKGVRISVLGLFLTIFGGAGLVMGITFAAMAYTTMKSMVWISSAIGVLLLGIGIPKLKKSQRIKKAFVKKYDIQYYFKL